MNDLVSIITPTYNASKFIEETINSVIHQSYECWELIIIDDCSTDNTVQTIKNFIKKDKRIHLIQNEKNLGPALTRNKGIKFASGAYVAFLDSDDLWKRMKLERQIQFMQKNGFTFTYSFYEQIDENGKYIKSIDKLPSSVNYYSSLKSNKIGCLTVIYNQEFFGKIYMENIPRRQDYTLWLKFLKKTNEAYCMPEILASYRVRKGSISSNKLKLVKDHWNIYRNIERHSVFKSSYFLTNYIITKFLN